MRTARKPKIDLLVGETQGQRQREACARGCPLLWHPCAGLTANAEGRSALKAIERGDRLWRHGSATNHASLLQQDVGCVGEECCIDCGAKISRILAEQARNLRAQRRNGLQCDEPKKRRSERQLALALGLSLRHVDRRPAPSTRESRMIGARKRTLHARTDHVIASGRSHE